MRLTMQTAPVSADGAWRRSTTRGIAGDVHVKNAPVQNEHAALCESGHASESPAVATRIYDVAAHVGGQIDSASRPYERAGGDR